MIVSQIAYNHLEPYVKARCDTLIAVPVNFTNTGTTNFVTASAWADDFKNSLGTGIWHYIDLPFSLDGTPTNGVGAASFDVVRAINANITALLNPSTTQSNKAVHLRYLLHFVGDIHQPLHSSTAVSASSPGGDAGGNGFNLNGDWNNLHSLWDAGGGYLTNSVSRPLSLNSQSTLDAKVAAIEADYPYNYSTNRGIPNFTNWANEGWALAQSVCYVGINEFDTPSASYLNSAIATTEQRMAVGGHRLADLLNTIFAPSPITLSRPILANGKVSFSWNSTTGITYRVQWKQQLTNPAWTDLTNILAVANSISFTESPAQTQRFYRVTQ